MSFVATERTGSQPPAPAAVDGPATRVIGTVSWSISCAVVVVPEGPVVLHLKHAEVAAAGIWRTTRNSADVALEVARLAVASQESGRTRLYLLLEARHHCRLQPKRASGGWGGSLAPGRVPRSGSMVSRSPR